MNITRENITFFTVFALCVICFIIIILRLKIKNYTYMCSFGKILFDYSDKLSFFPFSISENKNYLHIVFHKHPFSSYKIRKFYIFKEKIYITDNFKKQFNSADLYNPPFENLILNNFNKILKSMPIKPDSVMICSLYETTDIYMILDSLIPFLDKIYISTSDEDFYKKTNQYSIQNYGLGLLKKSINETEEYDLIIILNERKNDFFKKGNYVINLMKNHPVFNCNLLFDFYNPEYRLPKNISIRNAYFSEDSAVFLKLQWKIMKKS